MIGYIFNILRKIAKPYQTFWWKSWIATHTCKFRWYFWCPVRPYGRLGHHVGARANDCTGLCWVGWWWLPVVPLASCWEFLIHPGFSNLSMELWPLKFFDIILQSSATRIAFWTESASTSKSRLKNTNLLFHLQARIPNSHFEDLWNRVTHQHSNLSASGRSWCHQCRNVAISMRAPWISFWLMTKACSSFWLGAQLDPRLVGCAVRDNLWKPWKDP